MKKQALVTGIAALLATSINTASALEFGIFSDVILSQNDAPGENAGFALGAIDFFASANINDETRVFVEYVFEETGEGLVTDLERLWITRTFSDEFNLGAGRFHTPLGTWNRTYHHGAILQDTVSRPFFLDFEDGDSAILPTHIVGVLTSGTFIFDNSELSYEAYIANGPSLDSSQSNSEIDINVASDPNSEKTLGFRITYSLDVMPLQASLMYMDNTIAESADTGGFIARGETLIEQAISGFDINYITDQYDFLLEYYSLSNNAKIGNLEKHKATAYFAQFGYRLNQTNKIIYRYADLDGDANDDYLSILGVSSANHHVAAYRYDIDESNSIKFEWNKKNPEAGDADTTLTLQWAFMIP